MKANVPNFHGIWSSKEKSFRDDMYEVKITEKPTPKATVNFTSLHKCFNSSDKHKVSLDKVGSERPAYTSRPFNTVVPPRSEEVAYCSACNLMKLTVLL